MIIDDLDVIAVTITPDETDSPLLVDADGMLPLPVSVQGFQLVSRRKGEHTQLRRRMQLQQLPQRNPLERPKSPKMLVLKQLLGLFRGEALDHTE